MKSENGNGKRRLGKKKRRWGKETEMQAGKRNWKRGKRLNEKKTQQTFHSMIDDHGLWLEYLSFFFRSSICPHASNRWMKARSSRALIRFPHHRITFVNGIQSIEFYGISSNQHWSETNHPSFSAKVRLCQKLILIRTETKRFDVLLVVPCCILILLLISFFF